MEKAVLWIKKLNVTQGMNGAYSHNGELAIDMGRVCEWLKAPFTGTIKKIYEPSNSVWLESNEPVLYADGTVDYMTIMTHHDNDISGLYVGKVIKQGETYYNPGTKGLSTGPHIHLAIGKGKFTGSGWHKGEYQPMIDSYCWVINNQYNVVDGLFLYDAVEIEYAMYDWKRTGDLIVNEITPNVERNENVNQVEVLVEKLRVRTEPNLGGSILGFSNIGFYNVYDQVEADGYIWMKIAENQWIATVEGEWTIYYPANNYEELYKEALEKIKLLEIENDVLKAKIAKAIEDLT